MEIIKYRIFIFQLNQICKDRYRYQNSQVQVIKQLINIILKIQNSSNLLILKFQDSELVYIRANFVEYLSYINRVEQELFLLIIILKRNDKIVYHDFIIDDDDYIQIIFGCYKKIITQFGVITYKGKQVIFGQELGERFKYLYMGFTFTTAFGFYNYEGELESLGFHIQKLPKEYLLTFFSPLAELLYPDDFINNNFINQSSPQINQQNNQEIQPFCEKISNQQISSNNNAQNQYNRGNQINYGQKYGVQSMMVIETDVKKQNNSQNEEKKSNTSFTGNMPEKLFIVLVGCVLIYVCCKTIKDKINHDDKEKEGYRR